MNATEPFPVIGRPRPPDASDHPRLDSRRVTMKAGTSGVWLIDGRPCIALEVFEGRLHIAHGLLGEPMQQRMALIERERGPARLVFGCPRCAAPAVVLYLRPGPDLVCRGCASRLHPSAAAAELHRHFRLQRKIERRIGGAQSRPVRMSEATYLRLRNRLDRVRGDVMAMLGRWSVVAAPANLSQAGSVSNGVGR